MDEVPSQLSSSEVLGKRKRNGDVDYAEHDDPPNGAAEIAEDMEDDRQDDIDDSEDEDMDHLGDQGAEETLFVPEDDYEDSNIDPNAIYCEASEDFPAYPVYDKAFPKLAQGLTGICQGVLEVVKRHPCDSEYVQNFSKKASEFMRIPKPEPFRIALAGDTGVGKSSLLNSITDVPNLAKAVATGESCTSCATEYCGPLKGQVKKFAAEITYFKESIIRELLKEHYNAYLCFLEGDPEWDQETQHQFRRRSETALKTFHALFCNLGEFKTIEDTERFLKQNQSNMPKTLNQMHKLCKEALKEAGLVGATSVRCFQADERKGLRNLIDPLLNAPTEPTEPSFWPLVEFVKIGVIGSRSLKNVSICDLPGLSDTNQVKVNAANNYLRTCHGLWIVAPVGRAIHSPTIDNLVFRYEERFRGNIVIVCTKSEENIDNGVATTLQEQKQPLGRFPALRKKATDIQTKLSSNRKALQSRMRAKASDKKDEKVSKVKDRIAGLEKQKAENENEKWCALVEARNNNVIRGLTREIERRLSDGRMPLIFCVSNQHYLSYKGVADSGTNFQLSPAQTAIPALRKYVLGLAAPALLRTFEDFVRHEFTVFLKGVHLWVVRRYVEGAAALLTVVERPQQGLSAKFLKYQQDLDHDIQERFVKPLSKKVSKFGTDAQTIWSSKVERKHPSTLRAFIKKNGNHSTQQAPQESWNEQFLRSIAEALQKHWSPVPKAQAQYLMEQTSALQSELHSMYNDLKAQPAGTNLEMEGFFDMLNAKILGIDTAVTKHQERFIQELKNIKLDATQDRHTGFFTQIMQAVYDKCNEDKGKGVLNRNKQHIGGFLEQTGEDSPFSATIDNIASAVNELANNEGGQLEEDLLGILTDIYAHFKAMIATDGDPKAEEPLRTALKTLMDKAQDDFNQMQRDLERIKAKYAKMAKAEAVIEVKDQPEADVEVKNEPASSVAGG